MAILKDLIVHGSSRFLNKIYAEELETSAFEAESAIIKKLKADDATVVGLLDVQGQLHTSSWTNSNIATIDGSFYIAPTIGSNSGNIVFSSTNIASLTGDFAAVNSLYIGGSSSGSNVQWTSGSKVLLTGEVKVNNEWLPLGTLLGTLSENAGTSSIGLKELKDNRHKDSSIIIDIRNAVGSTSLECRNLKISLYQRASDSRLHPMGIYMTALGTNSKTFIDIYGGVQDTSKAQGGGLTKPNVRIGNLSGLDAVGGISPIGWGIYTTNGYFDGVIVSSAGKIGGWSIGTSGIYNGITGVTTTGSTAGTFIGTGGISNYKNTDTYVNIQNGVITAKGVNLTGQINATAGNIGGATITGGTLTVPAAYVNGELTAATINGSKIIANTITAGKISVDNLSAINTNLGTITTGVIKHDTVGGTNGIWLSANTNTSSNITVGNSTARNDWRLLVNNKFGVTSGGDLYASNANITGSIYAIDGNIGGIEITDGSINGENFGINEDGSMYIVGNINATGGRIGDIEINEGKMSFSNVSLSELKDASQYIKNETSNYVQKDELQLSRRITTYYLISPKSIGVTFEDVGWSTEVPSIDEDNKYLWAYQVQGEGTEQEVRSNPYLVGTNDVNQDISSIQEDMEKISKDVEDLGSWITLGRQNDVPTMRLGQKVLDSSGSEVQIFSAVFTNEKLAFQVNGREVAYIQAEREGGEGKLYATNSVVANEIQFGEWIWYQRRNGHLSVKWKGESDS